DQAMQETAASPGATANMVQRAGQARAAIAAFWPASGTGTLSDNLVAQLQQVLAADSAAAAAGPAGQAATLAGQILNGTDGSTGARAAYLAAQQAADYFPQEAGATAPDAPPVAGVNPDGLENDDLCSRAKAIPTDGAPQNHTFHYEGDQDWVRFTAQANKTYVIEAAGTGDLADPVIFLHDACNAPAASFESNAFGNTIRLLWNSTKNGVYYIQLRQFDPVQFGAGTEYTLKVTLDATPPAPPINLRCLAINQTTLGLQWQRSPEPDVASYRITYSNQAATDTGVEDVQGAATTFIELGGLTPNELYTLQVRALDYSRNESDPSGAIPCRPVEPTDRTAPLINALQPTLGTVYTTTAPALTFSGTAQDPSGNLSRAIVRNESTSQEKSDFSLAGATAQFRVEDVSLRVGSNQIQVRVIDGENNSSVHNLEVRRLAASAGAALIVAGHNETFGLQTNIYNATNRAYRIFQSAGFSEDDIYYLAPVAQDATGDGVPDTQNIVLTPGAVQAAITGWAKARVGPDKPFFVYLMDHGFADKYCVTGCTAGNIITPAELNSWLREMEDASGVDEVNIVIEACQSGSFLDNLEGDAQNPLNSLARQGRVVVTSTGRVNNAYASADGAYFSDAFFSCLADSGNLKTCFDEGMDAVTLAGVDQTPWLDDNADGVFSNGDGSVAAARSVTSFFSSVRPQITSTSIAFDGSSGLLRAQVAPGAESIRLVWAAVYPPSFQEPDAVTLNLNVPVVRLEPVAGSPGRYEFNYINGFSEQGDYRIIFYAQDRLGINAKPVGAGATPTLYLPNVNR
ncbi:MAG TPA: fibronectin type III domain-containing protein, partial [Caldilineaceae bacterium]|nr:fibronectin type III domain-containing protein [Caldilineaceae bacterium]